MSKEEEFTIEEESLCVPSMHGTAFYRLCRQALIKYGWELQKAVFHEEIGEMFQSLGKVERARITAGKENIPPETLVKLAGELADSLIVMEQVMIEYGLEKIVQTIMQSKLKRLDGRINGEHY